MINTKTINFNEIPITTKSCGQGKDAIIFIHGNGQNSDTWLPQFENKELSNNYQLIAFDLPGHGQSGWFKNDTSAYRPKKIAPIVKTILREYNVERYILVGLSLGTNVIGEICPPLPGCAGIFLEGTCIINDTYPPAEVLTPNPNGHVVVTGNPTEQELRDFTSSITTNKGIGDQFIKSYREADPAFREELGKTLVESDLSDELANIKNWNVPVCVLFGKEDKLIKIDYLDNYEALWNKKVYVIENAGHVINEEEPEAFNKLLLKYAEERFR